jgi:hypothetical protein
MTYYFRKVECLQVFILQFGNSWNKNFHCNGLAEAVPSLGHHVPLTLLHLISSEFLKLFVPGILIQLIFFFTHSTNAQTKYTVYSLLMLRRASVL